MNYLQDDKEAITQIVQQAPEQVTYDQAKMAYYNAKRDVSQALANLWDLPPLAEKPKPIGVDAEKWTEIRNTCDEFDAAATKALVAMRSSAPTAYKIDTTASPILKMNDLESVTETDTKTETENS
jgi:hypothetical protein